MPVDRIANPAAAANLYANMAKTPLAGGVADKLANKLAVGDSSGAGQPRGISFGDFLADRARDTVDTLRTSEKMSAKAVTGQANLNDVVEAVNAAEMTLQTVVAVRDRVINAYQEILRMPI